MDKELRQALPGAELLAQNLLQELAIFLARRLEQGNTATHKSLCRVARAIKLIEEHYQDPLELHDLSTAAVCSPNQLIRDFKAVTGETPKRYLSRYRLERACSLLQTGSQVLDACLSVGFNDINAFTRQFKQRYGCTPGKWRPI